MLGDNLENVSLIGAIAAYYQNATVQTQFGPMLMRERLLNQRLELRNWQMKRAHVRTSDFLAEMVITRCCERDPDCLYKCARCRKLCCWCFGGTSCVYCDSCTVELSNARERLNKLLEDEDDEGFNHSIIAIARQELHDAFSETSVSTAEILSHAKRVESRLLKELEAIETQLIDGGANPDDLP